MKPLLAIILVLSLSVLDRAATVTVQWNPSPDPRATGYVVVYGYFSGCYTEFLDVGDVTQTTISDLQEGLTYYFACYAYGSAPDSPYSNEVSYAVPVREIPLPPRNLQIRSVTAQTVTIH